MKTIILSQINHELTDAPFGIFEYCSMHMTVTVVYVEGAFNAIRHCILQRKISDVIPDQM